MRSAEDGAATIAAAGGAVAAAAWEGTGAGAGEGVTLCANAAEANMSTRSPIIIRTIGRKMKTLQNASR
jgi:hypothetical protein